MSDPRPEELIQAENLLYNGKVDKALEIINNFQNKSEISLKSNYGQHEKSFNPISKEFLFTI